MDATLAQLRERIVSAHHDAQPLRLRGSGSKDFFGETLAGEILDTRAHAGILDYQPSELVITARCGTRLSEIAQALAGHDQFLAFEPPVFGAGDPTIGGVVAAGLAGPRRAQAGAVRDFVLGASLLDAQGNHLHFGGQVMKNVAGFDLSRLLCGSLGILGLIAEVSLKVLPRPPRETTVQFECDAAGGLDRFNRLRAQPLPVSASAWNGGIARVRLSGSPAAISAARAALGGDEVEPATARSWWHGVRDQTHAHFNAPDRRLWRLSLPATAPLLPLGADLIEWSGALRWLYSDAPADRIREDAERVGGTAMLWRGRHGEPMFHPLAPPILELHRRLKYQFDPRGIFNRGRLVAEL